MKLDMDVFKIAGAALSHAGARQGVIAQNIANADTPNYAARDLKPFSETYQRLSGSDLAMRATRPQHIEAADAPVSKESFRVDVNEVTAPNGNSVSLEDQMMRSAQVNSQHNLALGIYQKSLTILRATVSTR